MSQDNDSEQRQDSATPQQHREDESDATTERVEQYARLHEYVERLREEKRPDPPGTLSPDEIAAFQMAALLRSASPERAEPSPQFAAALRERLSTLRGAMPPGGSTQSGMRISRRSLLGAGLATASAAAGIAIGATVERVTSPAPAPANVALVPEGTGTWVGVTTEAAVPLNAIMPFTANGITGFVRRTSAGFLALSGVCTHMGCLLQWNEASRTFDCPCHGGVFTDDGQTAPSSPWAYNPLPRLQVRVESGQVQVYVPVPGGAKPASGTPGTRKYPGQSKRWK